MEAREVRGPGRSRWVSVGGKGQGRRGGRIQDSSGDHIPKPLQNTYWGPTCRACRGLEMLTAGGKFVLKMSAPALSCGGSPLSCVLQTTATGPWGEARKPHTLDYLKRIQARRDRRKPRGQTQKPQEEGDIWAGPKETTWILTHEGSREGQVGRGKSMDNASQGRQETLKRLLAVGGEAEGVGSDGGGPWPAE